MPHNHTNIKNADDIIKEISFMPSTIETIDIAFYNFINDDLGLSLPQTEDGKEFPLCGFLQKEHIK